MVNKFLHVGKALAAGLFGIVAAGELRAAQFQPLVAVVGEEGQWWNNYSFTIANSGSNAIELRDAVLTFDSKIATTTPNWSANGVSYPTLVARSQSSGDQYSNRVRIQFDHNGWTDTELEPGNNITFTFGVNGQLGLDLATATALFTTKAGEPEPNLSVVITTPVEGQQVEEGMALAIKTDVSTTNTSLDSVEFYVDSNLIGTDSKAPYEAYWQAIGVGNHRINVIARTTDSLLASQSLTVGVTAATGPVAPEISISYPSQGDLLFVNHPVRIMTEVHDANADVESVEFFVNGHSLVKDTSAPYAADWRPATTGDYNLSALVTDSTQLQGETGPVSVSVIAAGNGNLSCDIKQIYRADGSECMGDDHPRRIIGYFTSWRTGNNGYPAYLAKDLPWDKLTHINYAFASVNPQSHEIQVDSSATTMTWEGVPGAEMDATFPYQGHFNHLSSLKRQYPDVKTLISVGGWAESTGFYSMTTDLDTCAVNMAGIDAFNASVVAFIRQYGFDGVDIDYEYPSSMKDSGNPTDFAVSNICRAELMGNYKVFMLALRDALDAAGVADNRRYMLTIAAPASGYLLRGMEDFALAQVLDYVNIMSYDLHGAWNEYVGPQAALFDNGDDAELAAAGVYSQQQYQGIGYLNLAWAYQYFRGIFSPAQINIGVPYYTRGFQGVNGGNHGLWGSAILPNQTQCQPGTGTNIPCGYGAQGIDNLWHDLDDQSNEIFAGSNPMWHAMNLKEADSLMFGNMPSYGSAWGLDASNSADTIQGDYEYHYSQALGASWLWNPVKKVFLSIEDETSLAQKLNFIIDSGAGGMMVWEMAGDYEFDAEKGEYYFGNTLTTLAYNRFASAPPMNSQHHNLPQPDAVVEVAITTRDWPAGDSNYPLNPTLVLTNNDSVNIPTGATVQFLMSTATSDEIKDWDGAGVTVVESGHTGSNFKLNGQRNDFHKAQFQLEDGARLDAGTEHTVSMVYYLPVSGIISGVRFLIEDQVVGLKTDYPHLPAYAGEIGPGSSCTNQGIDPLSYPAYPNWPQQDWAGNPSHAMGGDRMRHMNVVWQAKWWNQEEPGSGSAWDAICDF